MRYPCFTLPMASLCLGILFFSCKKSTPASTVKAQPMIVYAHLGSASDTTSTLFAMNLDGTNPHQILNSPASNPSFAANGKTFFYTALASKSNSLSIISTANADGTYPQAITNGGAYGEMQPAASPDGHVVYVKYVDNSFHENLFYSNGDGTSAIQLTFSNSGTYLYPTWSHDSKTVFFESDNGTQGALHIYAIKIDQSGLAQITHSPGTDETPAVSPDGKTLVFSTNVSATQQDEEIFSIDSAGQGTPQQLTHFGVGTANFAKFTADGTKIIFSYNPSPLKQGTLGQGKGADTHVYSMNADGSSPVALTSGYAEGEPSIQPVTK